MSRLGWPGIAVIAAYLAGVMALGFRFARRQTSTEEYFMARRSIPGWAMGMSLFASIITSITFIAYPGNGFAGNWAELVPGLMALAALALIWKSVVPFLRRTVRMTVFEYFQQRFGRGVRSYAAATYAACHCAKMAFVIYLVSLTVHSLAGWPLGAVISGVGLATVLYTWAGGISAVIWVDVAQGCVLWGGIALSLGYLLWLTPGGAAAGLSLAWKAGKFSLGQFSWSPSSKSVAVMAAYGLFWYLQRFTTDQMIVQRYLVARSDRDAVLGVGLGAALCVPVWTLFLLIGSLTWSYYRLTGERVPAWISKADEMYPYFLLTHVPSALTGVILAALFSAAMSGLSSDFNSMAAVGVQDFYTPFRPEAGDRERLRVGRRFVFLAGLLCTLSALGLSRAPGAALPLYFLATSVLSGGLFGLFCLAYFTPRATGAGAAAGIAACLAFTLYATVTSGPDRLIDLHSANFLWNSLTIGAIGQMVVIGVGYPASLILARREASRPAARPCPPAR